MLARTVWATERVRWWWDECCRTHNCTIQNAPNVLFSSKMTRTAGLASGRLGILIQFHIWNHLIINTDYGQ